jgi:GNAT superfamily N-acetyltransferase
MSVSAILPLADLSEEQLEQAAQLVFLAFSEYYSIFTHDVSRLRSSIVEQFRHPTEVDTGFASITADSCTGVVCYYDLAEQQGRQTLSLKALMDTTDTPTPTFRAIKDLAAQVPVISEEHMYLSRIAVGDRHRGTGLAQKLFDALRAQTAVHRKKSIALHVRRDNARAIAFYFHLGFTEIPDPRNLTYLAMQVGL